jgi:hypothetical protein
MIKELLKRPQSYLGLVGGWLIIFGLTGMISTTPNTNLIQTIPSKDNPVKVVPAKSGPTSTINQLQGATNLQQDQNSTLQQGAASNVQSAGSLNR